MYRFLTLSAILLSLGLCHAVPVTNRVKHHVGIIQPNFTDVSNFSFNVAVMIGMDLLGGGVLVSQRWVLTAASVTHGLNMTDLRVRLGSNSAYVGGRHHKVHEIVEHPSFLPYNSSYDLALLRLDRNVSYQIARHISFLARVPFTSDRSFGNITGYGQDSYRSQREEVDEVGLEWTKVQLYSNSYCTNNYYITVPDTQFCAWSPDLSAPCYGDVGIPLTRCVSSQRCELLGIYTGYNLCGVLPYKPQTYLDISQFRDWVKTIIRQNQTVNGFNDPLSDEFE